MTLRHRRASSSCTIDRQPLLLNYGNVQETVQQGLSINLRWNTGADAGVVFNDLGELSKK